MAQIKKAVIEERIFLAAYKVFRKRGYQNAQIAEIAKEAKVTPSNIYNYYESKFHLFYAVYTPILMSRLDRLSSELADIRSPYDQVKHILLTLWHKIPNEDNRFSHNLIEAIIMNAGKVEKPHFLLKWCEDFIFDLLKKRLPAERRAIMSDASLAFLIWMAFDGFTVNAGMGEERDMDRLVTLFADILFGRAPTCAGS